jgi:chromosome segregation ATPase
MITQMQVDELLTTLQSLHEQIAPLRKHAGAMEQKLAQIRKMYEQKVGPLNAERAQLDAKKQSLRMRLAETQKPLQPSEITITTDPTNIEPPSDAGPSESPESPIAPPPSPPADPRAERKRKLADHLLSFLESDHLDSDRVIKTEINRILEDKQCDVGDMLESLSWGSIWVARADWETLEDQYTRLESWQKTLEARQAYWQREVQRMEQELYERWKTDQRDVMVCVDELAQKQMKEIEQLKHEVAVLEEQWQKKQATRKE